MNDTILDMSLQEAERRILAGGFAKYLPAGVLSITWNQVSYSPTPSASVQAYKRGPKNSFVGGDDFHSHQRPTMGEAVAACLDWLAATDDGLDTIEKAFYADEEARYQGMRNIAAPGRGLDGLLNDIANPAPVAAALAHQCAANREPRAMPILLSHGASQHSIAQAAAQAVADEDNERQPVRECENCGAMTNSVDRSGLCAACGCVGPYDNETECLTDYDRNPTLR